MAVGCSHAAKLGSVALTRPHGAIQSSVVRITGGTTTKRRLLRTILRGFGPSEIVSVQIRLDTGLHCHDALDITTRKEVRGSDRAWWDAQVVTGALTRLRRGPVCSLSVRQGSSGEFMGDGPGVGESPRKAPSRDAIQRAASAAAGAAKLRLVAIAFRRPVRIVPEIVLVARDRHDFEHRMDTFQRAFFPMMRHLDAFYVEVRSACGNPVWFVAGSTVTGAGGTWANRHWICPFGDAINQHCPKERATTNNPCI